VRIDPAHGRGMCAAILLVLAAILGLLSLSAVYLYQWALWQELVEPRLHPSSLRMRMRGWGPRYAPVAVLTWALMSIAFLAAIVLLMIVVVSGSSTAP
jgi:hypothetical protein